MKVNPIINPTSFRKPAFKGYFTNEYNYNRLDTHGQKDAIETTIGSFHPQWTGKVYYADPMEFVTDSIKEKADYIVYDKEPEFPDVNSRISQNYFGTERVDYKKLIDNFRSYFYRLEMADRKAVGENEEKIWKNIDTANSREKSAYYKDRIVQAQYNQETAANCMMMYDEAGDLRYRKEKAEDEIASLTEQRTNTQKALEKTRAELEGRKKLDELINTKIADLELKKTGYKDLHTKVAESFTRAVAGSDFTDSRAKENDEYQTYTRHELSWWKQKHGYDNPVLKNMDEVNQRSSNDYKTINTEFGKDKISEKKELRYIEAQMKYVQERIDFYKTQAENSKAVISKLEKYLTELPKTIEKLTSDISQRVSAIDKIKAELIPHFDKLKNYFYSRGIRVIR